MKITIPGMLLAASIISLLSFSKSDPAFETSISSSTSSKNIIATKELNASIAHTLYINISLASKGLSVFGPDT